MIQASQKKRFKIWKEEIQLQKDLLKELLSGNEKIPDLIFIIDANIESLAVQEAKKLKMPIIAILDTNSDPTDIDFPYTRK